MNAKIAKTAFTKLKNKMGVKTDKPGDLLSAKSKMDGMPKPKSNLRAFPKTPAGNAAGKKYVASLRKGRNDTPLKGAALEKTLQDTPHRKMTLGEKITGNVAKIRQQGRKALKKKL